MQANVYSKYALKDLHEAIDLIDRKIQHCRNFEPFDTPQDREASLQKLASKRAALVKSATALSSLGVICETGSLPRPLLQVVGTEEPVAPESAATGEAAPKRRVRKPTSRSRDAGATTGRRKKEIA
ncbi:MAG: hypothetical protein WB622_12180 [Acidobacteriaceae bacterium]|jgi:hypothetical protein